VVVVVLLSFETMPILTRTVTGDSIFCNRLNGPRIISWGYQIYLPARSQEFAWIRASRTHNRPTLENE
jgi:hypothetical protein